VIIKSFEVTGLSGREGAIKQTLNKDINIITGRNGSGKTTLIKLLWYIISGNIHHAIREIKFNKASIETDAYVISIRMKTHNTCEISLTRDGKTFEFEDFYDEDEHYGWDAEDKANEAIRDIGRSVFFPTFRRIEGGFSLNQSARAGFGGLRGQKARGELEEAMADLSKKMSQSGHTFVASISTTDIISLLMRQYTDMSELANDLQKDTSQQIIERIKNFKIDPDKSDENAESVLDHIKSMVETMETKRSEIMAPLDAVTNLAMSLFHHSGITLGRVLRFGDAANAVSSEALSAGEKQMLSFICYNAFHQDSAIFIDEPELSLHVDWQRQLFPILQDQGTSNQFIIATHSPFIYSKYPDKEISINPDKGE